MKWILYIRLEIKCFEYVIFGVIVMFFFFKMYSMDLIYYRNWLIKKKIELIKFLLFLGKMKLNVFFIVYYYRIYYINYNFDLFIDGFIFEIVYNYKFLD